MGNLSTRTPVFPVAPVVPLELPLAPTDPDELVIAEVVPLDEEPEAAPEDVLPPVVLVELLLPDGLAVEAVVVDDTVDEELPLDELAVLVEPVLAPDVVPAAAVEPPLGPDVDEAARFPGGGGELAAQAASTPLHSTNSGIRRMDSPR